MTIKDWTMLSCLVLEIILFASPFMKQIPELQSENRELKQRIFEMQKEIDELKSAVYIAPNEK